jgi:hypothetical protein
MIERLLVPAGSPVREFVEMLGHDRIAGVQGKGAGQRGARA